MEHYTVLVAYFMVTTAHGLIMEHWTVFVAFFLNIIYDHNISVSPVLRSWHSSDISVSLHNPVTMTVKSCFTVLRQSRYKDSQAPFHCITSITLQWQSSLISLHYVFHVTMTVKSCFTVLFTVSLRSFSTLVVDNLVFQHCLLKW